MSEIICLESDLQKRGDSRAKLWNGMNLPQNPTHVERAETRPVVSQCEFASIVLWSNKMFYHHGRVAREQTSLCSAVTDNRSGRHAD